MDPRCYYEFPPGTYVRPRPGRAHFLSLDLVFRVIANDGDWIALADYPMNIATYSVRWEDLVPVCRHCKLPKEDHGKQEQCLYSPTRWEK